MSDIKVSEIEIDGQAVEDLADKVVEEEPTIAIPAEGFAEDLTDGYDDDDAETISDLVNKYFPLPENWPTEKVEQWRSQFKNVRIRRAAPGEAYVIRPLLRGELPEYYKLVNDAESDPSDLGKQLAVEEKLVTRCVLYPRLTLEEIRGIPNADGDINPIAVAGTVSILAADILFVSRMMEEAIGPVEDL